MKLGFVSSQSVSCSEKIVAVLARETDPFQVVCFNVIFDVVYESLLSTHFASMSSSVIVAG